MQEYSTNDFKQFIYDYVNEFCTEENYEKYGKEETQKMVLFFRDILEKLSSEDKKILKINMHCHTNIYMMP